MPIPVLAGIPWLANIVIAAFSGLFGWFIQFFTRRFALVAAGIVLLATITAAFFVAIEALISGLSLSMPSIIVVGVSHLVPSNMSACLSILISARLLRYAYDWNVKIIQLKLF